MVYVVSTKFIWVFFKMTVDEIKKRINELYLEQEKALKEQYDRSLPFQDGLFDRFERAKRLGFGEGASIYNSALVFGDVKVGKKTWIGPNVIIDGSGGGVEIGDYCSISAGVHIYSHDSVMWALSGGQKPYDQGKVFIGSNSYIGPQSIIRANTIIGTCCLVGANSYVNRNVKDNAILVGSPGKIIGKVVKQNDEIILEYFE